MDAEYVSVWRVGRLLGKMRGRAKRPARVNGWTSTLTELQRWTMACGITWPQELVAPSATPLSANGIGGFNGITA